MLNGVFFCFFLVDSLSNDACSLIVGFGPTQSVLEVVCSAQNADVIGIPLPNVPANLDASVIGHVVTQSDAAVVLHEVARGSAEEITAKSCKANS